MVAFFTTIIYRPLLNLTILLYTTVGLHNLGFTIILMTVGVRLAMMPLSIRTARSQRAMAKIAPEMERIKQQHKGNTTAQSEATMALYREHGINPLTGCLPLLIQLPLLLGLYRVFINLFKPNALALLYSFVPNPLTINQLFLGLIDISKPSHVVAALAAILQFIQARLAFSSSQSQSAQMSAVNKQMMYLLPAMILVIGWSLPGGLAIYWVTTTLFSIGEQLYLRRT